jgi:hypothetical protein
MIVDVLMSDAFEQMLHTLLLSMKDIVLCLLLSEIQYLLHLYYRKKVHRTALHSFRMLICEC